MSKVTLKDIAKETGFSVSKVSRAISGTGAIKEEDQKIILQTAQRLGYKTSVVSSKSDSENLLDRIAVLIPKFNAYLTSDFIQRLNDRLLKNGYVVDYYTVEGSTRPEAELLQFIINKGYKAIIYKPRRVRKDVQAVINTTSTPIFSYGQVYGNCININYDNSRMMYEMTNIAIGAGAKKNFVRWHF
ncbi:LacI family DNA-binding transcriptional regulator [Lacticaseibacillus thailandensis]|uniref:LacI family DNA-binding transcriptional regulator n=1 Tax=Lacticaseibacillus thailandensis TaxID=381741 RepID=UPI0006D2660B|nr:LacI family DNA-binding transcriptional regulator [Lacticaseibacillus thailandensis]